jgi:hypothetical protein
MTIFYLQQLQMLPALRDLVPVQLLRQPEQRLLQVCSAAVPRYRLFLYGAMLWFVSVHMVP